ncbi:MAG: methylenetetrahydrofolate reductase [Bacillota bacterium]
MSSTVIEAIAKRGFIITVELTPPKGTSVDRFLGRVEYLKGVVDFVNVTDQQGANMALSSLAAAHLLLDAGIKPILQVTCRDRNRIALQSDLLGAYVLGVRNVLCLTGDHPVTGDHPASSAVFDLDSVSLLWTAKRLEGRTDLGGRPLRGSPSFCLGAAFNPHLAPIELQVAKARAKVAAGCQFFQTQPVFDVRQLEAAIRNIDVPVIAGVVLIKSVTFLQSMLSRLPGVKVPGDLLARFEGGEDAQRAAVSVAAQLIRDLRQVCQGAHIMAMGWEHLVPQVIESAGLV